MPSAEIPLTPLYDWRLVALSIVIAIFTCYTALDLAGRVTVARGRSTHLWLIGGAVTMGVSIWAMHFIGMEALTLPIPVAYHAPTVFVSMLVAMLVSGAAIYLASLPAMGTRKWVSGGVFMGLSIGAMHYIGMDAMRMAATIQYSPPIVILSLAIGIFGSLTALKLAFRSGGQSLATWGWDKIGSAFILGSAIGGLHYTAMGAVTFVAVSPSATHLVKGLVLPSPGPVALSVATFLVLNLALFTSLIDRGFAEALRKSEGRLRSLYKTGQAVVSNLELEPLLQTITDTAKSLLHARMSGLVVFAEGSDGCESVTVSGGAYNLDPLLHHSEFLRFPTDPGACRRVDNIATHITGLVSRTPEDPPLKAFLFIPLQVKGGNLGILFVAKGSQDTHFTKDDEDLLLAFANDAALALEHARLYDQQKRDVTRLKELSQELNEAQEKRLLTEERNRIAQEMHDQIAQVLFTIGLKATWCLERMSPDSEIVQPVHTIKRLASEGSLHIRNAIYNLSSPRNGA